MSTPPATGIVCAEQPLRRAGVVAEASRRPSRSRRARRRSACPRCAPRAAPAPRGARRRASARLCRSAARSTGVTARQAGICLASPARPRRRSPRPRRAAPPPSPARSPARSRSALTTSSHLPHPSDAAASAAAAPTRAPITRSSTSSSGCQSTPRANRRSGSSIASISSSSTEPAADDQPLADLVDPLVVVRLDVDPLAPPPPAAARMPGSSLTSWSPNVPGAWRWSLVADDVGQVLAERPAAGDVEDLHAAADAEQRHVALDRPPRQRELEAVALGPGAPGLGVRLGAVAGRVHVGAAGEHQRVEQLEHPVGLGLGRGVGRQQHGGAAGALDRGRVGARRQGHGLLPDSPAGALEPRDPIRRPHFSRR